MPLIASSSTSTTRSTQIHAKIPHHYSTTLIASDGDHQQLIGSKKPIINSQAIEANTVVTVGF